MSSLSSEETLLLLKQHCAEWKFLLASEIAERHHLGNLHVLEINDLRVLRGTSHDIAEAITRQLFEIVDLKTRNNEKRLCLTDKQFCEKNIYLKKN